MVFLALETAIPIEKACSTEKRAGGSAVLISAASRYVSISEVWLRTFLWDSESLGNVPMGKEDTLAFELLCAYEFTTPSWFWGFSSNLSLSLIVSGALHARGAAE